MAKRKCSKLLDCLQRIDYREFERAFSYIIVGDREHKKARHALYNSAASCGVNELNRLLKPAKKFGQSTCMQDKRWQEVQSQRPELKRGHRMLAMPAIVDGALFTGMPTAGMQSLAEEFVLEELLVPIAELLPNTKAGYDQCAFHVNAYARQLAELPGFREHTLASAFRALLAEPEDEAACSRRVQAQRAQLIERRAVDFVKVAKPLLKKVNRRVASVDNLLTRIIAGNKRRDVRDGALVCDRANRGARRGTQPAQRRADGRRAQSGGYGAAEGDREGRPDVPAAISPMAHPFDARQARHREDSRDAGAAANHRHLATRRHGRSDARHRLARRRICALQPPSPYVNSHRAKARPRLVCAACERARLSARIRADTPQIDDRRTRQAARYRRVCAHRGEIF